MNKICRHQPLVSVGVPTFNRPRGLEHTLTCLCAQTYENLEILVSDNGSPGEIVQKIIHSFERKDSRIKNVSSPENRGAAWNFERLLDLSAGDYFMWAADDDSWEPGFVSTLMCSLQGRDSAVLAFCDMDVYEIDGSLSTQYCPFYPSFAAFEASSTFQRLRAYMLQPPILGKANIIYGIHRKSILVESMRRYFYSPAWGSDMLLMAEVLSRGSFVLSSNKLYHKAMPSCNAPVDQVVLAKPSLLVQRQRYVLSRLGHNFALMSIALRCKIINRREKLSLIIALVSQCWSWVLVDLFN
jgi:glycosyltransferase involved in cell wall biosynthesis